MFNCLFGKALENIPKKSPQPIENKFTWREKSSGRRKIEKSLLC
jgi:hypothetical protein